jgi:lysophosphatidate acyltransferase
MAKKELQFSPLGGFMAMSGTIFIDRGNNAKAVRSMQMAGDGMKARKSSLWMYPEGTRHNQQEPSILPLKKGGFHLAIQAGIPIVPVVSENYWRLYHKGVFESGTIKMKGK